MFDLSGHYGFRDASFFEKRDHFAELPDAKIRGYKPGRFSFNKPGGRCEACEGNGSHRLNMDFLADVWVTCPVCEGKGYPPDKPPETCTECDGTGTKGGAFPLKRTCPKCDGVGTVRKYTCKSCAGEGVKREKDRLKVTVPAEISSAPWQVVFTYRSANGSQTDGRSPVLAPDKHLDYTLQLPAPTDALVTAQVQQYGPPPQANAETGEIEFPIRASWVLNAAH